MSKALILDASGNFYTGSGWWSSEYPDADPDRTGDIIETIRVYTAAEVVAGIDPHADAEKKEK